MDVLRYDHSYKCHVFVYKCFHFSYKQRKFNLFREECEGFAKLLTELNTKFNDQTNPTDLIGIVQSLIGESSWLNNNSYNQVQKRILLVDNIYS